MAANYHNEDTAAAITQFERDLEALLLEAFASGVPIEGDWAFVSEPPTVPDWTVLIEQRSSARDDDEATGHH